jgi:quercetin dioxygenase-like cupin family protein
MKDEDMSEVNRRNLLMGVAALVACSSAGAQAEESLSSSQVFSFDSLTARKNDNGVSRAVIRGVLPTGESVEVHETMLLPGHAPHPPHKHRHSEFMMIREGTVEFDDEGKKSRVDAGGVIFAASNRMHGLKNVGSEPANYFVIAIGREQG